MTTTRLFKFTVRETIMFLLTLLLTMAISQRNVGAEFWSSHYQVEGQIRGVVTDESGAIVPNVGVSIKSVGCKCEDCEEPKKCKCCPPQRELTTNDEGVFELSVPVGKYNLTFQAQGFRLTTVKDVTVGAGQSQQVNVTLKSGQ